MKMKNPPTNSAQAAGVISLNNSHHL